MRKVPECIFKRWIHSREEDTENQAVYRTPDYDFPLSRGRRGLEFKKNGEFVRFDIGPSDISRMLKGHFKIENQNKIKVFFDEPLTKPYIIEVISCEGNMLRIRK